MPQFIRIGFFLALRQIRRASVWTTSLIVFVMTLTFLNLVVVSGILVGLIEGAVEGYRDYHTSDVFISNLDRKSYIEGSSRIRGIVDGMPEVLASSARYAQGGTVEANYKDKVKDEDSEVTSGTFTGIDPIAEDQVTGLSQFVIEGEYLAPGDYDKILVGSYLLKEYFPVESSGFPTIEGVKPGTRVRIEVGGNSREVEVKGILLAKMDEINMRVYFMDSQLRELLGRNDYNVDEIAVKIKPGYDPAAVRDALLRAGVGETARVQTFDDAQPKFIVDMKKTFALLGNMISSIGLAVASVTIFIVIFINALTRRKFIGILKGIGISGRTIEASYVFQSFFYAVIGSAIGLAILYGFLVPYMAANPIDFTFSYGILVAPAGETFIKMALLVAATVVAGYIPARMIVRKNTLDSILGRQ